MGNPAARGHRAETEIPLARAVRFPSARSHADLLVSFRKGLMEGGYVDGQNVRIEYRFAEGRYDRLAELAPVVGQTGVVSHPMNHKGVEFVLLARPGRDRWTLAISYPRSANPTEMRFDGSRDEAIAAAVARIDGWLERQRATEKRAPSLPRADC